MRYGSAKRAFAAGFLALTVASCASGPVGVQRMDGHEVHRALTTNALSESKPSLDSRNVLFRYGLYGRYAKQPVSALAELHRIALAGNDDDAYFALAELSFLYGEKSGDRRYAVMAAIYAWAYLFDGQVEPAATDPRLRLATDLYNRGLTEGLTNGKNGFVTLQPTSSDLPIGHMEIAFDTRQLSWNGRTLHDFVPVAELEVHGLDYRFRTPGIGAPLAASAALDNPDESSEFLAARLKTPVTALVRSEHIRRQIAQRRIEGTLELHSDPNEERVRIDGREVPLEKEPSAVFASMLADMPVIQFERAAFFGTLTHRWGFGRLVALRPHVPGRIPVVFVHGTASSPVRWAEMVNVLDNDPRINERFEPWFFAYESSAPVLYSAYLLREALKKAVAEVDPSGTDPGIRQMVVIGHSQGGLLTKTLAVRSEGKFWEDVSSKPFDELRIKEKDRELLRSVIFFEPLPFVRRVVFICTPHRGSFLAAKDWIRSIVARLISLPATVSQVTADLLTMNPDVAALRSIRGVNAVDNMNPRNRAVRVLSQLPIVPEVTANSIIAVQGDGPLESLNDGVVEYRSAHIDGVESEKIVHSSHSTQAEPETIEEVRRILLKHAADHPLPAQAPAQTVAKAAARAS